MYLKQIWIFIKASWNNSLAERGDMFLFSISIFFTPFIIMLVWLVINTSGKETLLSYDQIAFYFLASILVKTITSSWIGQFLPGRIKRGAISPYLLKPAPFLLETIGNNIAEKLLKLIITIPMVLFTAKVLGMHWPTLSFGAMTLSLFSLLLAAVIFFTIDMTIGILAFWLDETKAIQEIVGVAASLFSGSLIPILMLPTYLQNASIILPFRYTLSLPIEILLNKLSPTETVTAISIQLVYTVLLIIIYNILWKKGLKLYSASGA